LEETLRIARALADETRLRAIAILERGDLCLSQMAYALDLSPSTVSEHMRILVGAGLVDVKRDGKWRYYRLRSVFGRGLSGQALGWAFDGLRWDRTTEEVEREERARYLRLGVTACYRS